MRPSRFRTFLLAPLCLALLLPMAVHADDAKKDNDEAKPEEVKFARLAIAGTMDEGLAPVMPLAPAPPNFRGFLSIIDRAAQDPDLEGVMLEVKTPSLGFAKVMQLNRALKALKASGKKIYLHSDELNAMSLMLGSLAHRLSIPESGWVLLPGLSAEMMYMRELFDLLGIRFDVTHVGAYKSAYENFSKEQMSEEYREVLNSILDEFWTAMVGMVAEGRGIPRSTVEKCIDDGFQTAKDAKRCGLIDAVEYEDEFRGWLDGQYPGKKVVILKKYGKPDEVEIDFDNPFAVFTQIAQLMNPSTSSKGESKDPKIALIYAVGQIVTGKSQVDPFSGRSSVMGSDTMVKAIRKAADDDTVKAIVMRVDSPGGSGLASDLIWREVVRAKKKGKPFIVSMSDVAGSGGYYISMAADKIVAEPTTLTGSIGVVSMFLDMTRLVRRVGINIETVGRGKSSGLFSPFSRKDEETKARFAGLMEDFYRDFVTKVSEGRGRSFQEMEKVARGRVWTGRQAKQIGLVDMLGGLDDALALARKEAGLDESCEVRELPEPRNFFDVLGEMFEGGLVRLRSGGLAGKMAAGAASPLLGLLPAEARVLLSTEEGRDVLERLEMIFQVASSERDRMLLLTPFEVKIR